MRGEWYEVEEREDDEKISLAFLRRPKEICEGSLDATVRVTMPLLILAEWDKKRGVGRVSFGGAHSSVTLEFDFSDPLEYLIKALKWLKDTWGRE